MSAEDSVARHYGRTDLADRLLAALANTGADLGALAVEDLAPVDAFHIRGRAATEELLALAELPPGARILDVGSGIGGTARYLATRTDGPIVGVDLTPEYCEVATLLTGKVGLQDRVSFRQGSALGLPFDDGAFDVVWTEHVQMNIADKPRLYGELHRVLRPGGRLVFHDIFAGDGGPPHFPVPWAGDASISHLVRPADLRALLQRIGFVEVLWQDRTAESIAFFRGVLEQRRTGAAPSLGLHLLMEDAERKFPNVLRNAEEDRIRVAQAVLTRGEA